MFREETPNSQKTGVAQPFRADVDRVVPLILECLGEGVAVADSGCHLVFMNPAGAHLLGRGATGSRPESWSAEYGMFLSDGTTPCPVDKFPLVRAIRGESVNDEEFIIRNETVPEGIYISASSRPLRDDEGELRGGVVVFRDISPRKRFLEALRASEERWRSLVENAPDYIVLVDVDARIQFLNRAAAGYQREEFIGTSVFDYLGEESAGRMRSVLEEVARTRKPLGLQGFEVKAMGHRSTQPRWFSVRVGPIERDGQLTAFTVVATDISDRVKDKEALRRAYEDLEQRVAERTAELSATNRQLKAEIKERQRAEGVLRESEARFRALVDTAPLGVPIFSGDGRFTYVNSRLLDMLGYSREELLGKGMLEFVHPEDADRVHLAFRNLIDGVKPAVTVRHRLVRKEGRALWCESSLSAVGDGRGNLRSCIAMIQDIDQRKAYEDELEASRERLRLLSRRLLSIQEEERRRIAREIHDELGQALTAIKYDVSWLSQRQGKADRDSAEKLRKMDDLIDGTIRTVRRISADIRPAVLDDLGLVAAIEWLVQEFRGRSGIRCHLEIGLDDPGVQKAAATTVFRVAQEALTNILRHAQATRLDIRLHQRDGILKLEIVDNGRGITEEEVSSATSLGLIGIRERAHHLGGKAEIGRAAAKGTFVRLEIPLSTEAEHD